MDITEVFTPNGQPTVTYVERGAGSEKQLQDALEIPKFLVAISGPSKMGKSVLCKRVIPEDKQLNVPSSEFKSGKELWQHVLRDLHVPEKTESTISSSTGLNLGVGAHQQETAETSTYQPIEAIAYDQLAKSGKVLVIDDFHYLDRTIQTELCQQLKHAIEKGAKIATICVTYKHEDPVLANPDLQGRVQPVLIPNWAPAELRQIIDQGFDKLNCDMSENTANAICSESLGSPFLTQYICLMVCRHTGITQPQLVRRVIDLTRSELDEICRKTSEITGVQRYTERVLKGPKIHGTERKEYPLKDKTRGDVYKVLLRLIAEDPPLLSLDYNEIVARAKKICESPPTGQQLSRAAQHMAKIATPEDLTYSARTYFDWDQTEQKLDLPNPMFVFGLRWGKIVKPSLN